MKAEMRDEIWIGRILPRRLASQCRVYLFELWDAVIWHPCSIWLDGQRRSPKWFPRCLRLPAPRASHQPRRPGAFAWEPRALALAPALGVFLPALATAETRPRGWRRLCRRDVGDDDDDNDDNDGDPLSGKAPTHPRQRLTRPSCFPLGDAVQLSPPSAHGGPRHSQRRRVASYGLTPKSEITVLLNPALFPLIMRCFRDEFTDVPNQRIPLAAEWVMLGNPAPFLQPRRYVTACPCLIARANPLSAHVSINPPRPQPTCGGPVGSAAPMSLTKPLAHRRQPRQGARFPGISASQQGK